MNQISIKNPIAGFGGIIIDGYPSFLNPSVSFPSGANSRAADEFIEADRIFVGFIHSFFNKL